MKILKYKKNISSILFIVFSGVTSQSFAALASNAVLDFNSGQTYCVIDVDPSDSSGCAYGVTNINGSYFGMDASANGIIDDSEKTAIITQGTGVTLGAAQAGGEIDEVWSFGGNPGYHFTQGAGPTLVTASGNTAEIDMTGWSVFWNGDTMDLGQGTYDTGSAEWNNYATITCGVDCSDGDSFTLDYAALVPTGCFCEFLYELHLEGNISSVPVPAAVWLFGSGLIGLVGVARRRVSKH